jgi:non-ribosomal peptide synthetase component F
MESFPLEQRAAQFDLTLMMAEADGELQTAWQYNTDLFDHSTIVRMSLHFHTLLQGIVAQPRQRVSNLPILSDAERRQILVDWNATRKDSHQPRCIHQLFEEQVRRTPNAVAIRFGNRELLMRRRLARLDNHCAPTLH